MIGGKRKKGFVLLFSVLLTGIILSIGLAMANIALKEIMFSATARESVSAFYAAASGRECAIYWDIQQGAFGFGDTNLTIPVTCNLQTTNPGEGAIELSFPDGSCAFITVQKTEPANPDEPNTLITSLGYNTCQITNPKRVERGVISSYRL